MISADEIQMQRGKTESLEKILVNKKAIHGSTTVREAAETPDQWFSSSLRG